MKSKHGQATIFVIVAVTIVVLILLFFLLKSYIVPPTTTSSASETPNQYISECITENIDEAAKLIIQNNGYISKSDYNESMEYEYAEIPYFCHTSDYYERCVAQEPVIISHLNEEIYNYLEDKIEECFDSFKSDLESDGYTLLSVGQTSFEVELMPGKVHVEVLKDIKFKKAEETKEFRKFVVSSVSPLYNMATIVQRIIKEESLWTNSGYVEIMRVNDWVDINKFTTGNVNEIYTVIDKKTGSSWRFAVKGGVLPVPK